MWSASGFSTALATNVGGICGLAYLEVEIDIRQGFVFQGEMPPLGGVVAKAVSVHHAQQQRWQQYS